MTINVQNCIKHLIVPRLVSFCMRFGLFLRLWVLVAAKFFARTNKFFILIFVLNLRNFFVHSYRRVETRQLALLIHNHTTMIFPIGMKKCLCVSGSLCAIIIINSILRMNMFKNSIIVGIGIPKSGSNKLDAMVAESFHLSSCNRAWAKLPLLSARSSIYCSWGYTVAHPLVKNDVLRRLGRDCQYLGTHQDLSIARVLKELDVSYVTMLREPIGRLVSGCNYHLGNNCSYDAIVEFARTDRGYGMPNRMTKIIAGLDPVCSLDPDKNSYNDVAILEKAKTNLREKFVFVGVLERLPESIALLPSHIKDEVVLPKLVSRGGNFEGDEEKLMKLLGPYVNLDQQLYQYANQILDDRLKLSLKSRKSWFDSKLIFWANLMKNMCAHKI